MLGNDSLLPSMLSRRHCDFFLRVQEFAESITKDRVVIRDQWHERGIICRGTVCASLQIRLPDQKPPFHSCIQGIKIIFSSYPKWSMPGTMNPRTPFRSYGSAYLHGIENTISFASWAYLKNNRFFLCNIEQFAGMPNDTRHVVLICYSDPHRRPSRTYSSEDAISGVREWQAKSGIGG
jgi:hypothetical protein